MKVLSKNNWANLYIFAFWSKLDEVRLSPICCLKCSRYLSETENHSWVVLPLMAAQLRVTKRREIDKKQNILRMAKAALHKLPGKSSLNVSFVFPVCPVHDMNKRKDNSISSTLFSIALLQNELTGQTISKFPFLIWESWSVMKSILVCGRFTFSWTRCSWLPCLYWIRL